jgi:hypothetical protein
LVHSLRADVAIVIKEEPSELRGDRAVGPDWLEPHGSDGAKDRILVVQPRPGFGAIHQRTQRECCHSFVFSARHKSREKLPKPRHREFGDWCTPEDRCRETSGPLPPGHHPREELDSVLQCWYFTPALQLAARCVVEEREERFEAPRVQ